MVSWLLTANQKQAFLKVESIDQSKVTQIHTHIFIKLIIVTKLAIITKYIKQIAINFFSKQGSEEAFKPTGFQCGVAAERLRYANGEISANGS